MCRNQSKHLCPSLWRCLWWLESPGVIPGSAHSLLELLYVPCLLWQTVRKVCLCKQQILSQTEQEKDKVILINTFTHHALVLSLLRGQITELILIQMGFRHEAGVMVVPVYP